jgi:hypothetical protein
VNENLTYLKKKKIENVRKIVCEFFYDEFGKRMNNHYFPCDWLGESD